MPVTLRPSEVKPEEYKWWGDRPGTAEAMLKTPLQKGVPYECKEVFQSTFTDEMMNSRNIHPNSSSFVYAAMNAYNRHHHLVIRPDDVWITILTQFSIYVNAHAEEMRSMFVAHEGKKELWVKAVGTRYTVNIGDMAIQMGKVIEENIVDPQLRSWIVPSFSTTEDNDKVVASVIMMATLQKYFDYGMMTCCGLPGVTLQGEQSDWEALLQKLDKLETFGEEPATFAKLLRPILRRFVMSFTQPESKEIKDFWQEVIHHLSGGSGPSYISGWITAFCFWDPDGKVQHTPARRRPDSWDGYVPLHIDDQIYGKIEDGDVVAGYAYVPVKFNDNGEEFDTVMLAGMVAIESRPSVERDPEWEENNKVQRAKGQSISGPPCSVIQPLSGWWIFDSAPRDIQKQYIWY
ncbi:hypothetical protein ABW19_dt0208505 [Dactylella cylindrospora]|nr:hypothetical protein ABW19_dt0208505 [Dactylella cylindrospora]